MPLLVDRRHFLADQQVEMVSTGSEHAACVTTDGLVYTWGCTDYGQMGIGDEENDSSDEPYVSHCLSTASFGNCHAMGSRLHAETASRKVYAGEVPE